MELGEYGVWTHYNQIGEENAGEAAALAESLGYGTFWLGGSARRPTTRPLLTGSERLTVATGIVNVWYYDDPLDLVVHLGDTQSINVLGRLLRVDPVAQSVVLGFDYLPARDAPRF